MVSGCACRYHFGVSGDESYEGIAFVLLVAGRARIHHFGVLPLALIDVVLSGFGCAHGELRFSLVEMLMCVICEGVVNLW